MADITVTAASVAVDRTTQTQIVPRTAAVALTAGQAIYYDSNGKCNLADADGVSPATQFDGIVLDTAVAGGTCRVVEEGWVSGFDLSGVGYNGDVFLSTTAGALATAAPANSAGATIKAGRCDWANTAGGTFEKILRVNRHSGINQSREVKTAVVALTGAAIHAGVNSWQNPEGAGIIVQRAILVVGTIATAAATVSIGTTAVSATTSSANLIDTLDVHSATGTFDNITDKGTNGKARQSLASGKWVTIAEASGDNTGLVATLYIEYILA